MYFALAPPHLTGEIVVDLSYRKVTVTVRKILGRRGEKRGRELVFIKMAQLYSTNY